MTEYWDRTERAEDSGNTDMDTALFVNGSWLPLEANTAFATNIKNVAKDAGLGKFRVLLNGDEIKPEDAPEMVMEGDKVELLPYDAAG